MSSGINWLDNSKVNWVSADQPKTDSLFHIKTVKAAVVAAVATVALLGISVSFTYAALTAKPGSYLIFFYMYGVGLFPAAVIGTALWAYKHFNPYSDFSYIQLQKWREELISLRDAAQEASGKIVQQSDEDDRIGKKFWDDMTERLKEKISIVEKALETRKDENPNVTSNKEVTIPRKVITEIKETLDEKRSYVAAFVVIAILVTAVALFIININTIFPPVIIPPSRFPNFLLLFLAAMRELTVAMSIGMMVASVVAISSGLIAPIHERFHPMNEKSGKDLEMQFQIQQAFRNRDLQDFKDLAQAKTTHFTAEIAYKLASQLKVFDSSAPESRFENMCKMENALLMRGKKLSATA